MSNWFDDNNNQINPEENKTTDTNPEVPSAQAPEAPKETEPGWQSSGTPSSADIPPIPPVPPVTSSWYSSPASSQPPQGNPQRPQQPGYPPQNVYNPYGWQPPVNPSSQPAYGGMSPQRPPRKKPNGTTVLVAVLSVICAAALITSAVLIGLTVTDRVETGDSPSSASHVSTSSVSSTGNENAPTLDITQKEEAQEGLSATAIYEKNQDSTVNLTMYSGTTAIGGATGIVWTSDGYIITNAHCVINEQTGGAYDRIDVGMYDGTVYENAEVIGADTYTDLAVIRVGAVNLVPAEFGDSSALKIGDRVVAIGNPGGLSWTVTQGIISGLARDVYEDTGYALKCLQTDAKINPGNSGGPLINSAGQVIAINSAKIVATGYEGIGFSIPINEAQGILNDLAKYGRVTGRVSIGITGKTITTIGFEGFRIHEIRSYSPLNGTKARVGDIITHVNGVRTKTYAELRTELVKGKVGDMITLTLIRPNTNERFDVTCTLVESQE